MSDAALIALAEQAGIAPRWRDAFDKEQEVAPDTLRAVLAALELPAGSEREIADSRARLRDLESGPSLPPLVTATAGQAITLPADPARFRLRLDDGAVIEGVAGDDGEGHAVLPAVASPGYHAIELGDAATTLAVAPTRCVTVGDTAPGGAAWGLAVQLYSLRRPGDGGIGDFSALADFARSAAEHGATAVAISPVHAQFSADPDRFSPYAPSSRSMLNVLHATLADDPGDEERDRLEALRLVDWPAATRLRLRHFRRAFEAADPGDAAFAAYRRDRGDPLESHARFEALHAHFFGADPGRWHWRSWPDAFRDPRSPEVAAFARDHAREVAYHAWLQFQAERGLAEAQRAALEAGMPVGLISDLAVGTDSGGSHAWSRQHEMLIGLTVGAPPDQLSRGGQNWGLVAFSPTGLRASGFSAYIEMIRAALRHAGGVRIDHALGLTRLWVVPDGAGAEEGAYLRFPEQDLLRLTALESHRHRAIVLGEDLGTIPAGFTDRLAAAGVMGLRVLWFERSAQGWFTRPSTWTPGAVAMTSTHDTATVAGWWAGADLDLRAGLGLMPDEAQERAGRETDRTALWNAFIDSAAAEGSPSPPDEPGPVVDAAIAHVGGAACELVLLPLEDALGQVEQPNLPGTLHEHPNWRRRQQAPAASILDEDTTAARLAALDRARKNR